MEVAHRVPEVWQGVNAADPILSLNESELVRLYEHLPQWRGIAVGPLIPFGGGTRARVSVDAIFAVGRDDAEVMAGALIREVCDQQGMEYDSGEWSLVHFSLVNGS